MSLSQTTGYAIRALACLADKKCAGGFIHDIAECTGVPRPYLAKVLRKLNEAGLVESKRGYKGGVRLARDPADISLLDICNAIDGEDYLGNCLLGGEFCSDLRDCPTHEFWKATREKISQELARNSLAEILKFFRQRLQGFL